MKNQFEMENVEWARVKKKKIVQINMFIKKLLKCKYLHFEKLGCILKY